MGKVKRGSDCDKQEFDQYSADYSDLLNDPVREKFARDPLYFHQRKIELLMEMLAEQNENPAAMSWLDVGCGQGDLLRLGSGLFAEVVGCDPASTMLPAQEDVRVVVQPSLDKLPFDDHSMHLVTAVCVFHHVHGAARTALAREIMRVMAPGGYFCLIEHNPWNPITRGIVSRCPVDEAAELLTVSEARSLFGSVGMTLLRTKFFLLLPERLKNLAALENWLSGIPLGGQFACLFR